VFGRRKREEAVAAEAAREADRHTLFAKLAERPEHICPFLGLEADRTGYVEGVSSEHRCFAFGDPASLSAEQQTRVCQERGYGNCPRYLRGVLVIPTEELEALRRPRPAMTPVVRPAAAVPERRRGVPLIAILALLLLVGAGGGAAYLILGGGGNGVAVDGTPSPTPTPSPAPTPTTAPSASTGPSTVPSPTSSATQGPSPTPEPTPEAGDSFAFYEVSVAPDSYTLFSLNGDGVVDGTRSATFSGYSFAQVEPARGADGQTYWVTSTGGLTGWAYLYPDSGDFNVRAVFLNDAGSRRSIYLDQSELTVFPEATPAP
jgi:hypothetical protein